MTTKQPLEGSCKGELNKTKKEKENNQGNKERVCFQHGVIMLQTAAASDVFTRRRKVTEPFHVCGSKALFFCMMQAAVGGLINEEVIHHSSSLSDSPSDHV